MLGVTCCQSHLIFCGRSANLFNNVHLLVFLLFLAWFSPPAFAAEPTLRPLKIIQERPVTIVEEGLIPREAPAPPLEVIEQEEAAPEDFFDLPGGIPPPIVGPVPIPPEVTYDVPVIFNDAVAEYILLFQTRLREKFELWLARSGRYIPLMKDILKKYALPEDLVYLVLIESGFSPHAYSRARAVGPWQFMKGTARKYGLTVDSWVDERRDPVKSTMAAARYLKDLYAMFNSWELSWAAYNAGEGRVRRALARTKGADDIWDLRVSRHLRLETKNYVPKFMAATIIAKNPLKYGFSVEYQRPLQWEEVEIPRQTPLSVIARAAGISLQEASQYNPELRRNMTPPGAYQFRLPRTAKERFLANLPFAPVAVKEIAKATLQKYRVRRGDTLYALARKFDTTIERLKETNNFSDSRIRTGQTLLIPIED